MNQNNNGYQARTATVVASYSGFWIRCVALVIDFFITMIPTTIVFSVLGLDKRQQVDPLTTAGIIFYLSMFAFWILYFGVFQAKYEGTLGKRIVGIRLVTNDFKTLSIWQGIFRYFMYNVSAIPLFDGFLLIGLHSQKKGLHDIIVKTVVVPNDYLEAVRSGKLPDSSSKPINQNNLEAIDRLHQLKQKGALTEEEYREQKNKLI